jgi:microcystin degradation protein MlrC
MDGHWLSLLRNRIGKEIPIIGTIDPHANVSRLMASSTDALVAYKTNPHIDQRKVGKEAACILVGVLRGKTRPLQFLFEMPLAISIEQQYTGKDPCKGLYAYAAQLGSQKGILSVSVVLGFPYADVREMGTSVIVVSDDDEDLAIWTGRQLEAYIVSNIEKFSGDRKDIASLLPLLENSKKPVLMLDMGDNIGGGAPGNSIFLLEALEEFGKCKFFICLYDPLAVLQAGQCKTGDIFSIAIANKENREEAYVISVILLHKADGKFKETDPRHGGQVNYDMGDMAIVSTLKGNVIMITTRRIPPFSLRQLTSFNISPEDFDVVVAKGVNAPIAAYTPVCPTIMQVDTPGVTQADMTRFNYKNRRRPLFPFESV